MIRLTAFLLFLFSLPLQADTQVTHTFEDGEVISAEEFNKNFDDLEAAIDAVGGGGGGGGGGGAGARVWRDAGGNLFPEEYGRYVLYRFPESDYVFQIWNYTDESYAVTNLWFNTPDCSGQPVTKLEDQSFSWKRGVRTSTHWLLPDFNASEIAFSGTANNLSFLRGSSGECETLTNDFSFAALPLIQSSAPLDLITPPIELIWAD